MDNIGDLIYIVLLAIIGIGSFINSARKKKKEAAEADIPMPHPETVVTESEGRGWWDIIQERQPEQPKPKKKKSKQAPARTTSFLSGEEGLRQTATEMDAIFSEQVETPILQEEAFRDPEELRKAVIYAEILHRKY